MPDERGTEGTSRRYGDELGVDWCVRHKGVRNEDSKRCDAFDWCDDDEYLDDDGEYLPCDLRELVFVKAPHDA